MDSLSVCIATQTPLVQFLRHDDPSVRGREPDLDRLIAGRDYRLSPGGVTRMVFPLARRMIEEGRWSEVHWVALNPNAPPTARFGKITLHHVAIDPQRLRSYGAAKETIWTTVHGLEPARRSRNLFWSDDYGEYTFYNRRTTQAIEALDRQVDFDAFYVHDFQLLPLGQMLGSLKPKIFRWHIPFDARTIPGRWQPVVRQQLSAYDTLVVSSERYRTALEKFGYRGRVECLYPYIDPNDYGHPRPEQVARVAEAKGLSSRDHVVLVVGRMDPSKRQDRAIEAVAALVPEFPTLRLVLVGNGSFSGSAGGLSLSKSELWKRHLSSRAEELGVADRVVFTGHVSQHELDCLYRRALFSVLPSDREGFGLVVVESWLHSRPAVVSSPAGVADLVEDGVNSLVFDPKQPDALARRIGELLALGPAARQRMGHRARETAQACTLEEALPAEAALFRRVLEA